MEISKDYIGVGCGAFILNDEGKLLMQLRNKAPEKGYWSIPGGKVELFETFEDAVVREIKEETGLDVEVGKLIGVYTDCDVICANGDEVQSICIGYEMSIVGGELVCDKDETLELKYFSLDEMPELFCKQHEDILRDIKGKII